MLWYGREPLIQHEFQGIVVYAHDEGAPPEVWTLVSHGLDQADELSFVRRDLHVAWCKWLAEEREWPSALVQNDAKAGVTEPPNLYKIKYDYPH